MIIKDPKRLALRMMILCVIIGLTALAVAVMAISMQKYIIAGIMVIVAIMQIGTLKYGKREQNKNRNIRWFIQSYSHRASLALANYLCEYSELDEIWFLVSPHNPLKKQTDLWDDSLRLELVQLAIADYPKFRASDFEFHLPRPSYMIHTLDALQSAYPEREFTLIIGADNWAIFPRWYHSDEIIQRHRIMIYPRPGYTIDPAALPPSVQQVDTPLLEISSTFIRRAFGGKERCKVFPASGGQ